MRIELEKRDLEARKKELDLIKKECDLMKKEAACNSSSESCEQSNGKLNDHDLDDWGEDDWAEDVLFEQPIETRVVPKVFYCSRTHKQLEQVVGELRRTTYAQSMKMTLLSSREYTCIQAGNMNKTKLCAELLDPSKKRGCCYYTEDNKNVISTFQGLERIGVKIPWDIEELKRAGKSVGICPYFAARNLMAEADLILCPYNYIIDQGIRESMQINVAGSIIIIDEAHNIEDFCREAGSKSMTVTNLETIISNCDGFLKESKSVKIYYTEIIRKYCVKLSKFILDTKLRVETYGTYSIERWTGSEFIAALQKAVSLTPEVTRSFIHAVREASAAKTAEKDALRMNFHPPPALDNDNLKLLEDLVWALEMITSSKYANDYRMYVKQFSKNQSTEISLEFLCMNSCVVFTSLCAETRSIILASGTLSPMSSFESELGVKFPYVVQADHVTPKEQVCIKCIEKNSEGVPLKATFQNTSAPQFQDDIGSLVLTACSSMPHGILFFFSSYLVMEKHITRWQTTGLWNKLCDIKQVFQEPRDHAGMQETMAAYREVIVNTEKPMGYITGALLFAVYRGKVAEGIDFSDNEARCVITLGIPYAVRQDPAIDLKYRYNDLNRPTKGVLSGNEWYTTNAFRGLNQALGRAIRHQNDWAAIIMIDERIVERRHVDLLPKWVRSMGFPSQEGEKDLRSLLNRFRAVQTRRAMMKGRQNASRNS